jgi:hypothetical protein
MEFMDQDVEEISEITTLEQSSLAPALRNLLDMNSQRHRPRMADTITEGQGDEIVDLLKDVLTELREINSKCDELGEINRKCDEVDKTLDEIKQHAWSIAFEIEHRKNK